LRCGAGVLEDDFILAVTGDFAASTSSRFAIAALEVRLKLRPWR
jgi:hypothetical protein